MTLSTVKIKKVPKKTIETDLYQPVKQLLESQGYEVKGEIHQCDVVGCRNDEMPVIVELKLSVNITLLMQAVERLSLTDTVYIAIPITSNILNKQAKSLYKLIRMLGLGLISVDLTGSGLTSVMIDPVPYKPRKSSRRTARLLGEFNRREGDPNSGGADRSNGLMTAYRQRALRLAKYLQENGQCKASAIAAALEEPKARNILYADVYGWFERHGAGQYGLSSKGADEITNWLTRASTASVN